LQYIEVFRAPPPLDAVIYWVGGTTSPCWRALFLPLSTTRRAYDQWYVVGVRTWSARWSRNAPQLASTWQS